MLVNINEISIDRMHYRRTEYGIPKYDALTQNYFELKTTDKQEMLKKKSPPSYPISIKGGLASSSPGANLISPDTEQKGI